MDINQRIQIFVVIPQLQTVCCCKYLFHETSFGLTVILGLHYRGEICLEGDFMIISPLVR